MTGLFPGGSDAVLPESTYIYISLSRVFYQLKSRLKLRNDTVAEVSAKLEHAAAVSNLSRSIEFCCC